MDVDEIVAAIRGEGKLSSIWPDYPCEKCGKTDCSFWQKCQMWNGWFRRVWREMRRNGGRK